MDITKGGWNFYKRRPPRIFFKINLYCAGLLTGFSIAILLRDLRSGLLGLTTGVLLSISAFLIMGQEERREQS